MIRLPVFVIMSLLSFSAIPIAVSLTAYCILCTFCIPAIPPPMSSFMHYVILPPVVENIGLVTVVAIGCLHM